MSKVDKNREILNQLTEMIKKEASAGSAPKATGVPGKDTKFQGISEATETINKNEVGADKNKPQDFAQKPVTDASKPLATAKKADETEVKVEVKPETKAEEKAEAKVEGTPEVKQAADATPEASVGVEKLGKEILDLLQKFASNPVATGIPGKDTNFQGISEGTEKTDKNGVGADKNGPQTFAQKPAIDPSKPLATAKKADEQVDAEKAASYQLGVMWANAVIKQAQEQQAAVYKEAGRKDFETLIAKAAEALNKDRAAQVKQAEDMDFQVKQAEEAGAQAFQQLLKQAQLEYAMQQAAQENAALAEKVASLEKEKQAELSKMASQLQAKEAELNKIAEEQRENEKFAAWSRLTTDSIMERLRSELLAK